MRNHNYCDANFVSRLLYRLLYCYGFVQQLNVTLELSFGTPKIFSTWYPYVGRWGHSPELFLSDIFFLIIVT